MAYLFSHVLGISVSRIQIPVKLHFLKRGCEYRNKLNTVENFFEGIFQQIKRGFMPAKLDLLIQ